MAYTDNTKISKYLQRSLTTNETDSLTGYILAAVDKWINNKLNSQFDSVSETTRYFDGGDRTVDLDPVQAVTAVKSVNDDQSVSYDYTNNTEYVLEPANTTVKNELVSRGRNGHFPWGISRIAVTGKFTEYDYANSTVPEDIILLATRLAAAILNGGKQSGLGNNVKSEELGSHKISYDTGVSVLDDIADSDPILKGILDGRREIFLG